MTAEKKMTAQAKIREKILASVREYYNSAFAAKNKFIPGDKINYGGRFFDETELINLVDASLDFWLTTGRYCSEFESSFTDFLGVKYCSLTNSGSSANLLAFMALTSAKLGERRIRKGDEVITVAAGFPTTVAPIIQYGAVPVFVDVTLPEYNIDVSMLEKAYSKKTKAVMVAHTLGNPFDLQTVKSFCDEYNLWLIEDNCDALGSKYYINGAWKYTGTIGDIGTSSFYPPHHMTMGEGGAVYTDNPQLHRIVNSFRDWGRDCWCASGHDDTCQNRFSQQFADLPLGYDHKYVYSHFGYNLKVTEMQAAIGCAQLKKLPSFIKRRKENWQFLRGHLSDLDKYFILPEASQNSEPSWFGFLITVRESASFSRNEIVAYLEEHNIQTRMLFAGNLIKHPCFDEMRGNNELYRVVGSLDNTDRIMEQTFWLGVYPGIDEIQLNFMLTAIRDFLKIN
ncbi:lipopolysaccharide biosynthesis protein RfbH [Pectinatus haikarae]|uniref:CDP-6-deoxy-D-xylo-4-hexulose-3-dehydrase n=1 Tax=Pectinatus haikarae TaxID=349096 RepID=A0ABT9YB39_9FIRM|nr:lipopolysaccharide biosynthesis protein RfbH [Pectinatus haikarae]MDQ0205055.1 CDP-6-deoxy-D-xylo-4-hexulose-3-dehydrase [Pectinatus haikarae]